MNITKRGLVRDLESEAEFPYLVMRYQDVLMALVPFSDALEHGRIRKLTHKKTQQIALAHICGSPSCGELHGGLDIIIHGDLCYEDDPDRFYLTDFDLPDISVALGTNDKEKISAPLPRPEIEAMTRAILDKRKRPHQSKKTDKDIVETLLFLFPFIWEGGMYLALDMRTGFTTIFAHCNHCARLHAAMSVRVSEGGESGLMQNYDLCSDNLKKTFDATMALAMLESAPNKSRCH